MTSPEVENVSPEEHFGHPRVIRAQSFMEPEITNPFIHELKLPWYEYVKIAMMTVTIAPIRLLCFVGIMSSAWILAFIGTAGLTGDEGVPFCRWRSKIAESLRILGRAAFFVAGFHWIKIKGKPASEQEAGILVIAPHSSWLDVIVMFSLGSMPMPISRQENFSDPLIGRMLRMTQPIFVKREDPQSRQRTVAEIKRRARGRDEGWPQVCLFPEGTTTNRSCLISFKPGAFLPGQPVQPLVLRWPNRVDWITWTWQGHGVATGLWLGLCQFHNYAEIEVLPLHHPTEAEKNDPVLFANNVRREMAECLGVPMTDHSYEDCRLMILAKKHNLPMASGIVEFSKLHQKLGLNYEDFQGLLKRFTQAAGPVKEVSAKEPIRIGPLRFENLNPVRGKPVAITLSEFAKYLHLPVSPALKRVFDLYDRSQSGTMDFREYVIGLCLVSSPANTEKTIRTAFEMFDREGKGFVSREDVATILGSAFSMTTAESTQIFDQVDDKKQDKISYEDFLRFAKQQPEYAKLFDIYINFDEERARGRNSSNDAKSPSEKKRQ